MTSDGLASDIARHLSMEFAALMPHYRNAIHFIKPELLDALSLKEKRRVLKVVQSMINDTVLRKPGFYGQPGKLFRERLNKEPSVPEYNKPRLLAEVSQYLQENFTELFNKGKRDAIFFLDCNAFQVIAAEDEETSNDVIKTVQLMIDNKMNGVHSISQPYTVFNLYYGRLK